MQLVKYIGIANLLFITLTIVFLTLKDHNFSLKKHTFSCLGNNSESGKYFNLSICIFSVIQVLFAFVVASYLPLYKNISLALFVTGGLVLFLSGMYTCGKYPKVHAILVVSATTLIAIGVSILILNIFMVNLKLGILLLIATSLVFISFLLRNKLKGGYWELILATGVSLWNIIFTIFIIIRD